MKTFNELNEHHDVRGESWPEELLAMTVDELLDRLSDVDQEAYEEIEAIISRRTQDILGNAPAPADALDDMPTFDEMGGDEIAEIEDRLKGDISPESRLALMKRLRELKGEDNIDNFTF